MFDKLNWWFFTCSTSPPRSPEKSRPHQAKFPRHQYYKTGDKRMGNNLYIRLNLVGGELDQVEYLRGQTRWIMYLMGGLTVVSTDILDDTAVDTRPSIGQYSIEYTPIYRWSIDRCTDRYCYRTIYLAAHRWFTDTSPMIHWYFTDTSPSVLVDIGRYIGRYIGR